MRKKMKFIYKVNCNYCGKSFNAGSSTGKWCSTKCYNAYRVKKRAEGLVHTQICKQCGNEFVTTRNNKLFCSNKCAKKGCQPIIEQHKCLLCGVAIPNNRKYCETCIIKHRKELNASKRKKGHEVKCLQCGKYFIGIASNRKFCSKACLVKWHNNRLVQENSKKAASQRNLTECVVCGKTFFPKNKLAKCCSLQCTKQYQHSEYYKRKAYNYNKQYRVEKHENVLFYSREHEARVRQRRAIEFQKNLAKFDIFPELAAIDAVGHPTSKYSFQKTLSIIRITENKCKCEKCGNTFLLGTGKKGQALSLLQRRLKINKSPCPYCGEAPVGIKRNSTYESEIKKLYPQFDINVKPKWFSFIEDKSSNLVQLELDLYDKQKRIAVEFNGIVWHSTRFEKETNSLMRKTNICENHFVHLFHIWEYEWIYAKKQVINILNKIFGQSTSNISSTLLGNECYNASEDLTRVACFADQNNIKKSKECSWACALVDSDENILATAEFYQFENEWILDRYTEKIGYVINGGLQKCLSLFWREHSKVKELSTYADRRWVYRNKNIYLDVGFKEIEILDPKFIYTDLNIRHISNMVEDLSEKDGLYRLYDAGYIRYLIKK